MDIANKLENNLIAEKSDLAEQLSKLHDEYNTISKTEKLLRKENTTLESHIRTLQGNINELKSTSEQSALTEKKNSSSQLKKVIIIILILMLKTNFYSIGAKGFRKCYKIGKKHKKR